MTLLYNHNSRPAIAMRRRLPGTKHTGASWTMSVRAVRAALTAARQHAPIERVPSGEHLAELAIDLVGELSAADRALLALVIGDLVRLSRRNTGDRQQLRLVR